MYGAEKANRISPTPTPSLWPWDTPEATAQYESEEEKHRFYSAIKD